MDLQTLRGAHLRRDELTKILMTLPEDVAETALVRSYVRLTVQGPGHGAASDTCVLAEVVGIEPAPAPYRVTNSIGEHSTVKVQLRCKRGSSKKPFKISHVSNKDVTESEFEQWKKLTNRTGVEAEHFLEQMKKKAQDIHNARRFTFDEAAVARQLARKPKLEFLPQKESKMTSLLQCALSQMDISGIRENDIRELDARYKKALTHLQTLEAESTKLQEEWFEARPNLYSLKEINRKNVAKQMKNDKHALEYTYAMETGGSAPLNPFQRRPCRPICAWDTQLTKNDEEEPTMEKAPPAKDDKAGSAAPLNGAAAHKDNIEKLDRAPGEPHSRVDGVLKAHRRANLLAKIGGLTAL